MKVRPDIDELFERRIVYPDFEPQERLAALVGLEDHKRRLTNILALLVNADGLEVWAKRYHPGAKSVVKAVMARPPLVVLAGDVGSGKSALAETIGDAVARQENIDVTLFPLSLSTRGEGRVGEMTQLLSAAFEYIIDEAKKLKDAESERSRGAVILLVDEADALAQSREASQMHHEDRAGVNAFIRGGWIASETASFPRLSSCARTGRRLSTRGRPFTQHGSTALGAAERSPEYQPPCGPGEHRCHRQCAP